jgi:hypothetical protein
MATDAGLNAEHPVTAKRKRRWLQFSLRTLLMLMLAFACGFGWLAYKIERAREQREAVKAIEGLGGSVDYGAESGGMVASLWKLLGEDLSANVTGVTFTGAQVTDAGLANLRGLTQLKFLDLGSTRGTDAGLEHLQGLTQLDWLWLDGTQVTDAGLADRAVCATCRFGGLRDRRRWVEPGSKPAPSERQWSVLALRNLGHQGPGLIGAGRFSALTLLRTVIHRAPGPCPSTGPPGRSANRRGGCPGPR